MGDKLDLDSILDRNIYGLDDEFKSKHEHVGSGFVYMGNVKHYKNNQTVSEAINEYYKDMNKTPKVGDVVTVDSNTIYVYLNIPEEKCLNSYVYRGNVNCKNQTVKEAIDEYYKGNNATPTVGDVVTVNSVTTYVYLDDWEKM